MSALPHLEIVADYGPYDLAFAEVVRRFDELLGAPAPVSLVTTAAFDSGANGRYLAERALSWDRGPGILFHNVAPRRDDRTARTSNQGEALYAAQLDNGLLVVGPNSAGSWAPLAAAGAVVRRVPFEGTGSQFRSRDNFPQVAVELWRSGVAAYEPATAAEIGEVVEPRAAVTQLAAPTGPEMGERVFLLTDTADIAGVACDRVVPIAVASGDLTAAGFCAAQLALNGTAPALVVVDVRSAQPDVRCAAIAPRGVVVLGPADPAVWQFLAEGGADVRRLTTRRPPFEECSRLRAAGFADEEPFGNVAAPPADVVVWVDGYGNAKNTATLSAAPGTPVTIGIGASAVHAVAAGGSFDVPEGVTAVSTGSSGWALPSGGERRFREVFTRGGSAAEALGLAKGRYGYAAGGHLSIAVPDVGDTLLQHRAHPANEATTAEQQPAA